MFRVLSDLTELLRSGSLADPRLPPSLLRESA